MDSPAEGRVAHEMVDLTPHVAHVASSNVSSGSGGQLSQRGPRRRQVLGIGDIVAVTIFEAQSGGLFIPSEAGSRAGNFVNLPDQQVDQTGNIAVPYAGNVPAAGRTALEVQATIEQRLRSRAIEPQAIVALKEQRSALVSVLGEVNAPVRFPINPNGERVLDAIARAGGPKGQGFETFVTVQRGGEKRTVYFNTLVSSPGNNVFLEAGDTVYVFRENRSYVLLGASGLNSRYAFESEKVTLAEALGKGGGLLDERANSSAIYIYRVEPRAVAEKVGVDLGKWHGEKMIPIIYRANLRDEGGFFLAQNFLIRDKDVIYIGNAPATDIVKFLNLIRTGAATVDDVNVTRLNLRR